MRIVSLIVRPFKKVWGLRNLQSARLSLSGVIGPGNLAECFRGIPLVKLTDRRQRRRRTKKRLKSRGFTPPNSAQTQNNKVSSPAHKLDNERLSFHF